MSVISKSVLYKQKIETPQVNTNNITVEGNGSLTFTDSDETKLTKEALYVPSIVFEAGTLSSADGKVIWNGKELVGNTFTQYVTFNEGLISHGDIVLNGSKLLLANGAAVEVYPGEDLPTPVGGYQKLQYYALYKEMAEKLVHNGIYHLNEMESINFALEEELDDLFSCEVDFTSGATPTVVISDSRIKWVGDDVNNGVFTPVANVRYSCSLQYDGLFVRGMTFGIPTI